MAETKNRIRWTSQQREQVTAALVVILRNDFTDYRMKHSEDFVQTAVLQKLLKTKAQSVLGPAYFRKFFTPEELRNFAMDVGHMWWKAQLDEDKKNVILAGTPTDVLINEIASRQQDALVEKLLDRLEGPLMDRLMKRLDQQAEVRFSLIEKRLRHNPQMVDTGTEKVVLPEYVILGLLPDQANVLKARFEGKAVLVCVESKDLGKVSQTCKDRSVLCTRFVDHAHYNKARAASQDVMYVSGGVSELSRVLQSRINDFAKLS